MDLIIRNGKIRGFNGLVDIAIKDGKFKKIDKNINTIAENEIDAMGKLVSPPFVESNVHLDSKFNIKNEKDNLGEDKETLTKDHIKKNAIKTIKWLIANGVLKIRTHIDISEKNLKTLEAILELKEELKEYIDIQVVVFSQKGIFTYEGMDDLMIRAVKMGADVIGGIPQVESTREYGIKSIEFIFNLAKEHGKLIDIYTDETGEDESRFLEVIIKETMVNSMEGLVTVSHSIAMDNYDNDYALKLIEILKQSDVNIITNPSSNVVLKNRLDRNSRNNSNTKVDNLINEGVNISIGNDNTIDSYGFLGKGNMLQLASSLGSTVNLRGNEQMLTLFDMITVNAAKTLNTDNYGIKVGNKADLIILDARDEKEAIQFTSEALYVIRKGNIISETEPAKRKLIIDHKVNNIDFKCI